MLILPATDWSSTFVCQQLDRPRWVIGISQMWHQSFLKSSRSCQEGKKKVGRSSDHTNSTARQPARRSEAHIHHHYQSMGYLFVGYMAGHFSGRTLVTRPAF